MAEAITYADLRFVKAPLKNATCQLSQEEDEDGDLTYENVQVCPAPVAPSSLASSGPGDKAGLGEQHLTSWPAPTPLATGRLLCGRAVCMQYVLLGLSFGCLLLGVAALCLGVRYLQASQELKRVHGVLESTNGSLGQQLRLAQAELEQREKELQDSRQELGLRQKSLEEKQQEGQDTQRQLEDCRREKDETKASLQREETQRRNVEERLENIRNAMKPLITCASSEKEIAPMQKLCCPLGWVLKKRTCFHISPTKKSWEESQDYCKSLSSELATNDRFSYYPGPVPGGRTQGLVPGDQSSRRMTPDDENRDGINSLLLKDYWFDSYWIRYRYTNWNGYYQKKCIKISRNSFSVYPTWALANRCDTSLPCICELAAVTYPDVELLQ